MCNINIRIEVNMKSGAKKPKEKAQQLLQSSAAKSRKPKDFFAASITPTNNNLAEKNYNAFLLTNFKDKVFVPLRLQIC